MSDEKWQRSSLRKLSEKLKSEGHPASPNTVGRLLRAKDYSLKANVKRQAGAQHPDRNTQFEYIEAQKQYFLSKGWPVVRIDVKKKEWIGNFKNSGRTWCLQPEQVNDHDFMLDALGRAVPYGIYVLNQNRGYVYVGQSADTAEFAVDVLARWWKEFGQFDFLNAPAILILCDCGGSNGYHLRLWKVQLQEQLADELHLNVTVCHYPTGASKWDPSEHRLFGPISLNWAGKPLRTFETVLALIRGTTTQTGLNVFASLVEKVYAKGLKIPDEVVENVNLERHTTCPNWNYTIRPRLSSA